MLTRAQALGADMFHVERNGKCYRWRRNGATKLWRTRPLEFRIPIKHGLYAYDYVTERDLGRDDMHTESECQHA